MVLMRKGGRFYKHYQAEGDLEDVVQLQRKFRVYVRTQLATN
jgi:hypothetical protein